MLTKNNCVGKKKHRCRLQSNQISERVLAQISERHGLSNKKQRFLLGIKRHVHFLMILAFCQWYCTSAMILLVVLVIIWYFHQSFCNSKISFVNRISFPLWNIIVNKKESLILRLPFCLLGRGGRTRCRLQSNQISERVLAHISERHGSSNKKQRFLLGMQSILPTTLVKK